MRKNFCLFLASTICLFLSACAENPFVMKKYGGVSESRAAYRKAMDYLGKTQNADGSWGEDSSRQAGLSSMVVVSFIANGEEYPSPDKQRETVEKGIGRLIDFATERAKMKSPECFWEALETALLFYSISMSYDGTALASLLPARDALLEKLIAEKAHLGFYADGRKDDILIAGFVCKALASTCMAANETERPRMELLLRESRDGIIEAYGLPDGSFLRHRGETLPDLGASGMGAWVIIHSPSDKNCKKTISWFESYRTPNGACLAPDFVNPPDPSLAPLSTFLMNDGIWHLEDFYHHGDFMRGWLSAYWQSAIRYQNPDGSWTMPPPKKEESIFSAGDSKIWAAALIPMAVPNTHRYWYEFFYVLPEPESKTKDCGEVIRIE